MMNDYGSWRRHIWSLPLEMVMFIGLVVAFFTYTKGSSLIHITSPMFAVSVSFAPLLFERVTRIRLPALLQFIYVVFIMASLFVGTYLGLYEILTFWDKVVHFGSGVLTAVYSVVFLDLMAKKCHFTLPASLRAVTVSTVGGSVALLWEIIEFSNDTLFGSHMQLSNADTMTDLINGFAGAVLVVVVLTWQQKKLGRTWLDHLSAETKRLNR